MLFRRHEHGLAGLPTALLRLAVRKSKFGAAFGQEDTHGRRVSVHHRLLARSVGDPQHAHFLILRFYLVVLGVHFDRVLDLRLCFGGLGFGHGIPPPLLRWVREYSLGLAKTSADMRTKPAEAWVSGSQSFLGRDP